MAEFYTCLDTTIPNPPQMSKASLSSVLRLSLLALSLASCSLSSPSATQPPANVILPSPEVSVPTAPSVIARVNGEEIASDAFQVQIDLYQAAQQSAGTELATENVQQTVLDDMVNRLLLAQGAHNEGFILDEATLEQRLSALIEQAGGQEAFDQWLSQHGYTADLFRQELGIEIEAAWMRNQITEAVPTSAEQVEARQILLADAFSAERLVGQLENGSTFDQIVTNNDPQRLGYLGWFPRGYLLQPEVEEAAFALQPGEYSGVIETELGFHLVEVLDRDPARLLSPQARLRLQIDALQDWLSGQRNQSQIEVFLP